MNKNWIVVGAEREGDTGRWQGGQEPILLLSSGLDKAWSEMQLKFSCHSPEGNVYLSLDPWYLEIDGNNGRFYLGKYIAGSFYEGWDLNVEPDEWLNIEIAIQPSSISTTINGQTFVYDSPVSSNLTSAQIYYCPNTQFTDPEIQFNEIPEPFPAEPAEAKDKALQVTVDFYDDMHGYAFDEARLDELFRSIADLGATKAYWIHHGDKETFLWKQSTAAGDKIQQSFEALGDDFLPAAVRSAHKIGLPLIGIFKPFDTAIAHYTDPLPAGEGEPDALGGRLWQVFPFTGKHPELCQQRRRPTPPQKAAGQIIIRSRKPITASAAQQIEIYTSDDNVAYSLYQAPFEIKADEHEIRINGLDIPHLFVALAFPDELKAEIQNLLPDLAHVSDVEGTPLEFTYGIHGRVRRQGADHLEMKVEQLDFRTHGIDFDCSGEVMPSANSAPRHMLINLFHLKQSHGVLGLAMTTNPHVPGTLSESEPKVHEWWLSVIDDMIDQGVDGVEIRIMNHGNIIDWEQYGFNDPVVEEYQRRWGVDIRTEDFSREKFRQLRGEFYTEFLRKASALARSRGKEFYLHVEDPHWAAASEPCPVEIEMQWRTWITEGLCDGVTFKAVNFWAHDTALGRELIAMCHARNIPVSFAPFIHITIISSASKELLESCMASPFDALNIYEYASIYTFGPEGKLRSEPGGLVDWLKSIPWVGQSNMDATPSLK